MKKFLGVLIAVIFVALAAAPAFAGPSRAIVQELGIGIGKEEVNVDVDWKGQGILVAPMGTIVDTDSIATGTYGQVDDKGTTGGDGKGNAVAGSGDGTLGNIMLSSVNFGLSENIELRVGRLPGLRSYVDIPTAIHATAYLDGTNTAAGEVTFHPVAPANYGATVKVSGLMPGLAVWGAYGMNQITDALKGNAGNSEAQSYRVGAAYTYLSTENTSHIWLVNAQINYGADSVSVGQTTGPETTTTEGAVAFLYVLRGNLIVGAELHYAQIRTSLDNPDQVTTTSGGLPIPTPVVPLAGVKKYDLDVLVPAIGARITKGDWTVDVIAALVNTTVDVNTDNEAVNGIFDSIVANVVGVPAVRVNYKF